MKGLRWILKEILPFWPRILLALLLSTLTISSHIGLMATSAYLLARAALHPPVLDLMVTIVGVRFFGISRAVFRYFERIVSHDLTFRVLSRLRVVVYQGIEPLAPARLLDYRSGDLLSRIVGDIEVQQNLFLRVLAPPLVAILVLIGYGGFLAGFDQRFAWILAGFFLLAGVFIPMTIQRFSRGVGRKRIQGKAKLNTLVLDLIQGMTEVLIFSQVEVYQQTIRDTQEDLSTTERRHARTVGLANALMGIAMNLGMGSILVLGVLLVEKGQIQGVHLGMLALGALSSFEAVMPLPTSLHHLEETQSAGKRLVEMVQGKNRSEVDLHFLKKKRLGGFQESQESKKFQNSQSFKEARNEFSDLDIEFSNVRFRYHEDEPWVLNDVTFTIPNQGRVAIIGPSGAGKTSLVNLLLRFWDYESGKIRIGGHELKALKPEDVRELIGVVTQRTHLFHATVKENLLLAKPDATDEELFAATRRAKIHDFILRLPQGYDTLIGEEGMKLSGGQQQRLAIARVLLKNAPILILDEATSGLDPVTERDVLDEINKLMEGRTTLVISHHLEALKDMDEIYVLNHGRVIKYNRHILRGSVPGDAFRQGIPFSVQ